MNPLKEGKAHWNNTRSQEGELKGGMQWVENQDSRRSISRETPQENTAKLKYSVCKYIECE